MPLPKGRESFFEMVKRLNATSQLQLDPLPQELKNTVPLHPLVKLADKLSDAEWEKLVSEVLRDA